MLALVTAARFHGVLKKSLPPAKRKAVLQPRGLFDFVSRSAVALAIVVYFSFIALLLYIERHPFPGFAGVAVNAANANVVPANQTLADGNFVVARGTFRGDGTLAATQVRIRKKGNPNFEFEVSLTGPITDFAGIGDFRVRGVRVDATMATQRACSGNNTTIGNGRNVEIGGAIVGDRVVAELLFCR